MFAGSTTAPVTDRFRDDVVLRGRSWAWLMALRQRLRAAVQMVDGRLEPVLPPADGPADVVLAGLLASKPASLRAAVSQAQQTRVTQTLVISPLQIHCLAIAADRRMVGTLLVAREQAGSEVDARTRVELETIATALSSAVEAHLGRASASDDEDMERIGALTRLLSDTEAVPSEREMVVAFADALAIWHDVELRGYLDTGRDDWLLEVTLPGADVSRAPSRVPSSMVPAGHGLVALTADLADRFGISTSLDSAAARLGRGRGSWLLVLSGRLDSRTMVRLEVYLDLVAQWIARRMAEAVLRVSRTMADVLLRSEQPADRAVGRAVAMLQQEVAGAVASLRMIDATGASWLEVGERLAEAVDEMVVVRRGPDQGRLILTVGTIDSRFTAHECRLADVAADLLDLWCRQALRAGGTGDRRQTARSTDQILERFASQAVERGIEVSAVILDAPMAAAVPGLTQRWLADVRRSLRVSDLAGVLGDGALGVLLHDTSPDRAALVARRLRHALDPHDQSAAREVSIGIAGRSPGVPATRALIEDARGNAASSSFSSASDPAS